jgi:hypothetical protein
MVDEELNNFTLVAISMVLLAFAIAWAIAPPPYSGTDLMWVCPTPLCTANAL